MKSALLIAAISGVLSQAQQIPPATPRFEVVSIRRHVADGRPAQTGPTSDGFRSIGLPLLAMFQWAYALPNQNGVLRANQIEGDPGLLTRAPYDVVAKVGQPDLADWQKPEMRQTMLRSMLQAMLADRCKVAAHYADKKVPVYELVVSNGGPKFKVAETVDTAELRRKHPAGGIMRGTSTLAEHGPERTQFYAISMAILTNTVLSSVADRPVIDKTGLTGFYDLALPSSALKPVAPSPMALQPLEAPLPPLEDESILTALPEALGLRLKASKGLVKMLVIDHIEPPSEN